MFLFKLFIEWISRWRNHSNSSLVWFLMFLSGDIWSCIINCKQGLPYLWTMQTNYNLESLACQFTDSTVSPTTFNGSAAFAFWSCPLCCSPNYSPLLSYHSTDVTNSFEVLSDSNITSNSSFTFHVCAFYNPEEGDATSLENQRIGGKASPHETWTSRIWLEAKLPFSDVSFPRVNPKIRRLSWRSWLSTTCNQS